MTGSVRTQDARMKRLRVGVLALLATLVFSVAADQANAKIAPRVGTPTTTFRVSFTAPFAADDGYVLRGVGPRRCPSFFESTGPSDRGERVVMRLTPRDVFLRDRRRWCRGSYVAYVYSIAVEDRAETLVGYFRFGVGRAPVSLEP